MIRDTTDRANHRRVRLISMMAAPDMKYSDEMRTIVEQGYDCPPHGASERNVVAFRWCADPPTTSCFSPQAKRNPPRLMRANELSEKCSCWGLSMHTSLEHSIRAFLRIESSFRMARKVFGGSVAEGRLLPKHGRTTTPDTHGHFALFEYLGEDVATAFRLHSTIPQRP
jgi:hypothetical protein